MKDKILYAFYEVVNSTMPSGKNVIDEQIVAVAGSTLELSKTLPYSHGYLNNILTQTTKLTKKTISRMASTHRIYKVTEDNEGEYHKK